MKYVVRLRKAGKAGLVPVKKMVTKKGKPYLQTFYVKPDSTPKEPSLPSVVIPPLLEVAQSMAAKREEVADDREKWEGPLGDDRVYAYINDSSVVRIPEDVISERFTRWGHSFVVHRHYDSAGKKFTYNHWSVTEASTGKLIFSNADSASSAKNSALERLDVHGEDKIHRLVEMASKVKDVPTERLGENPAIEHPPVLATEDDILLFAEHIYTEVLDQGAPEEDDLDEIITWIEKTNDFTTLSAVEYAMQDMDFNDNYTVQIAMRHSMGLDDAAAVWDDLKQILGATSEDIDTVMDWYDGHYDGSQINTNLDYLGTSSEYGNEWSDVMVMEYAIENDVSIETAQSVAEEATEEADSEVNVLRDVRDSQGNLWTTDDLETMVHWMGGNVSVPRDRARAGDRAVRLGDSTYEKYPFANDIAWLFMTKAVEVPYTTLYRGTPNAVWAELQPGETYECGFASFSTEEEFAGAFHRANANDQGYDRFIVVCEASEGESLYGIDIYDIGQNLFDEGIVDKTFDAYQHEHEVILRAPSLEVTRTEDKVQGVLKTRYIYVKTAEMELLDLLKSQFSSLNDRVWESFNEPLGAPRGEENDGQETVPPTES